MFDVSAGELAVVALVAPLAEKHWGETLYVSLSGPVERGAWIENGRMKIALENGPYDLGSPCGEHPFNELCAALTVALLGGDPDSLRGSSLPPFG